MTFTRAIGALVACALLFGTIGTIIGFALGRYVPSYYRSVFTKGHEAHFDPVSIGIGQGLTQGTTGGIFVGLIIVAILCYKEVRLTPAGTATTAEANARRITSRRVLLIIGGVVLLVLVSLASMLVGAISGERGAYHRRYLEERKALAPALASDPAFERLEIRERSNGGLYLLGELESAADLERLRALAVQAAGESSAERMLQPVQVRSTQ